MNDLVKIILFGAAAYGTYTAGKAFFGQLDNVDRTGLTLAGTVSLVCLGYVFVNRLDNTLEQGKALTA